MYESPYIVVRCDGKFQREFENISDVVLFLKQNELRQNYPYYWNVYDCQGTFIPHGNLPM